MGQDFSGIQCFIQLHFAILLRKMEKKYQLNTVWKTDGIVLDKQEKTAYMHTEIKIAIDVRKTAVKSMLQSKEFPSTYC